jgi:hypothetical protein
MTQRFAATILALLCAFALRGDEVLDNAAVIRMVNAGLSHEVIVIKIDRSAAHFDVATDALIALKAAGVPDVVIKAMLLKPASVTPPTTSAPPPAIAAPATPTDHCVAATHYALGTNGWAWVPASVCVTPREISVDEQNIPIERVAAHCSVKATLFDLGGDAEWWFTDGKETFKFRAKENEIRDLSDAVARANPAAKHGACADRVIRALMPK